MDPAITALAHASWQVEARSLGPLVLPLDFTARYPSLPDDLTAFLGAVASCVNPTETAWFLCEADYQGRGGSAFRWNEWELLSLGAAEGQMEWQLGIRAFWSFHLPVLMSVKGGYSYYALELTPGAFGRVVFGFEPAFEEVTVVAASFADFLSMLAAAA